MHHLLLSAREGEVILCDENDEEWDWTWITCADLSKCRFNLYGVFTVSFYQSVTDKTKYLSFLFPPRMDARKLGSTQLCCASWWRCPAPRTVQRKDRATLGSLRFQSLRSFKLWQEISNRAFHLPASHSAPRLCSCLACMPSITSHHAPLLWVCMRMHHIISSEIQLSKGQVSSRDPLCSSPLQNANAGLPILA